jgi:hypothetical protein
LGSQGIQGKLGAQGWQGVQGLYGSGTAIAGTAKGLVFINASGTGVTSGSSLWTDGAGSLTATANITAYGSSSTASDLRWKINIKTIEHALGKVKQLRGVMYDWNEEFLSNKPDHLRRSNTGLIAQEVEAVLPEVIHKDHNGMLTLSYDRMIGLVIESIKELSNQVSEIEKFIAR